MTQLDAKMELIQNGKGEERGCYPCQDDCCFSSDGRMRECADFIRAGSFQRKRAGEEGFTTLTSKKHVDTLTEWEREGGRERQWLWIE